MKNENKLEELRKAAGDAHIAKDTALASRDSAWDVYIDAAKCLYAARKSTQQAALASRDKAWELQVEAYKFLDATIETARLADNAYNAYKKYEEDK